MWSFSFRENIAPLSSVETYSRTNEYRIGPYLIYQYNMVECSVMWYPQISNLYMNIQTVNVLAMDSNISKSVQLSMKMTIFQPGVII